MECSIRGCKNEVEMVGSNFFFCTEHYNGLIYHFKHFNPELKPYPICAECKHAVNDIRPQKQGVGICFDCAMKRKVKK